MVEVLVRNAGKLVTQRQFLNEVWHLRGDRTNYLRVFMVAVRRKPEPDPRQPRYFITETGVGLRFVPEGRPAGAPSMRTRTGEGGVTAISAEPEASARSPVRAIDLIARPSEAPSPVYRRVRSASS